MEITKETIKEAYEKVDLKPIRGRWTDYTIDSDSDSLTCACGLSALYAAQTSVTELKTLLRKGFVVDGMRDEFGVGEEFIGGFVDAFDGLGKERYARESGNEDYAKGYKVGNESVELIFGSPEEGANE